MPRELDETWQLLDDFAAASRLLQLETERGGAMLPAVCELSLKLVGGDHASITTVRGGKFVTAAATSDVPASADQIQYDTNQGPCLEAIRDATMVRVEDLCTDSRWPAFGQAIVGTLGMRSMLSHVLPVSDDAIGAINVYAARPNAFTSEHETVLAIFGATATAALRAARDGGKAQELEKALRTSRRIGVALGILMITRDLSLDDAWALLSKTSQNRNVKISVLVEQVLQERSLELDES
ncbi:ANTAR domain-containing protein [Pedococcus dokdonensis]|uniref:ANTAR domain-containing protein n=1 Tax=Pedococcus dokdonensis TaxID=443156 RepID=A0A1H0MNC5_9MICO|nr:GAF and ANTAR domain-containing protein [Pedococcus dokdonensis]SDO81776.1 ANTAR domain-containing protein [Pedococcus dokdonensis]